MEYKVRTNSEEETIEIAEALASERFPNMIICLTGELGSGKTIFAKGIAKNLKIKEPITSPTFTIVKEYQGKLPLYHMDVYRLNGNISWLGLDEYFTQGGIVVIEWADTINNHLPKERLDITIKVLSENKRMLIFQPKGEKYNKICGAIL